MFGSPTRPKARALVAAPRLEGLEARDTPTLFATGDTYTAELGRVLTVPATQGVLANDFSDTFPGQTLSAQVLIGAKYVGNNQPLPAKALTLSPDGSFTFVAPSTIPQGVSQVSFTYQATNPSQEVGVAVATINLRGALTQFVAVGADAGGGPRVQVYEARTGQLVYNFFPFEPTFTGGVRVGTGDVTGDGTDDIIAIPANGGGPRVRVFDGRDGATLVDTFAFDPAFRGGAYVAVGDFNGDATPDIVVGAGEGGGPRVQVFAVNKAAPGVPAGLTTLADFFAYDAAFRGGVRVAAGDVGGIGRASVVTAPGAGGGTEIRVFEPGQVTTGGQAKAVRTFLGGDAGGANGVFIATGDFRGDGLQDIVVGSGSGTPIVRVYDGRNSGLLRTLAVPSDTVPTGGTILGGGGQAGGTTGNGQLLTGQVPGSLLPGGVTGQGTGNPPGGAFGGGVRVAAVDYTGDGIAEIVAGAGPGNSPRVRILNTVTGTQVTEILAFEPTFLGGVTVSAGQAP